MTGLREKQKEDRKNRILNAARSLFADLGYEKTTIEAIADSAQLSGVTVHNYYGTKSGVLMAMVTESDRALLDQINHSLHGCSNNLVELTLLFAEVIRRHATTHLDKSIWRQVIASSISDTASRFGKSYHALDHQLVLALVREIEDLQKRGYVNREVSAYDLGKALFNLQNARFIEFIAVDSISSAAIDAKLRTDIESLLKLGVD